MKSKFIAACVALLSCLLISDTASATWTLVIEENLPNLYAVSTPNGRRCTEYTEPVCVLRVWIDDVGHFMWDVNSELTTPSQGPNEEDALDLGQTYTDAQTGFDAMKTIIESGGEIPYLNPPGGE